MTTQHSYTKDEQELRKRFREMLDQVESDQDVKKFFYQIVRDLLERVAGESLDVEFEDVQLDYDRGEGYVIAARVLQQDALQARMQDSDLDAILNRFAETAWNTYRHWRKNPEKTEQNVYPKHPSTDERRRR